MHCDCLWKNARLLVTRPDETGFVIIDGGVVAAADGRIVYVGPARDNLQTDRVYDVGGRLITPGLIDPHTHLIYGGDRAHEFKLRLEGASYEEIARAGGGIVSTMKATRAASEAELIAQALPRLDALLAEGVSTIEIKSGYGLTLEDELKMLRAARALEGLRPVRIKTTFLGAHALPPEFAGRADDYITEVCERMIPAVAAEGLADAVDVFCEGVGFSPAQTERVFQAARAHGLHIKLHAEQLSNLSGSALAARYSALSADHLEYLDDVGIAAMKASSTVATLLPGAFYFVRETKLPPVQALRDARVPMALATDCNPGTSPLTSLLLVMNMAATLFRMTVDECLLGVTLHAARALGLHAETGSLEAGKACDLAIWDVETPEQLVYRIGFNPLFARVFNGVHYE
ncbi:imidazolonepropionase [Asticcacaulis sp. ZE23SCel15]|uniref:imidazolonepropionase n=1 Tax=Asticcacaulis sp. ZE23SCel15 TaxID=3059027 RepID=UPI00265E1177|nr:imidazolonepropionase [Asticcacaulis sp. ZE23SCel15]WKL56057.1 imidazolonepropionase [Asticcacaulis sp. ZE23SCel15]